MDANITGISLKDGGLDISMEGGACKALAELFAEQFIDLGGVNYVELVFDSDKIGPLVVTMQRIDGMTPGGKVAKIKELIRAGKLDDALKL